jgi:hypothetical protein
MTEIVAEGLGPQELHQVRLLAKAFKQSEYYGYDHPMARDARRALFEDLREYLENATELEYRFTPSQVLLQEKATKREDPHSLGLAEGLYKKGISGIRFFEGLTQESLNKFIFALSQNAVPSQGDDFWNLPGLTVWSLILKDGSPGEEDLSDNEKSLRALVQQFLKPAAPPELTREEEILEWAVQDEKHLTQALEMHLQGPIGAEGVPSDAEKAEALSSFMTGLAGAYDGLLPDKKETFIEKMGQTVTEIDHWEHIWFGELPSSATPLKTFLNLIPPPQTSRVISQMILSLLNKGPTLASFLKQCEGELGQFQSEMPEIKDRLERAVSSQKIPFADLWSMVQRVFLEEEERQLIDDLYLKQLEGFSENLPTLDWEASSVPEDLKKAFGKLYPLEGADVVVSYLLEFLSSSKDIQDLIGWINELAGIAKELSLSGDVKHLTQILQEVSKAIAGFPFHDDPSFPEILTAWEKLNRIDHTEMLLNLFPTAGEETMHQIMALLPFLSEKTIANLLRQLQETDAPWGEETFFNFLLSGGRRIIPPLISILQSNPTPPLIRKAFRIILHFQVEEAVPLIPSLLAALDRQEKAEVIKSLTVLKFPELASIFLPLLTKGDHLQAGSIIEDLQRKENGPVLFVLLTELRTGHLLARYGSLSLEEKILRGLGKIGYEPAVTLCRTILLEKNLFPLGGYHKVKQAAGYCLKAIGTDEALSILEQESHSKSKLIRTICRDVLKS